MYRPHAAREDTVLFVGLYSLLSQDRLAAIAKQMDDEEEKVLGDGGFEKGVGTISALEMELGIEDLSQFTPKTDAQPNGRE